MSALMSGITPAGAGKTAINLNALQILKDHPRRCGENRLIRASRHPATGSPPQVRGKLFGFRPQKSQRRITPAGAGKTVRSTPCLYLCWDHPRRCGENTIFFVHMRQRVGSPPQVRGKPTLQPYGAAWTGITPAGAGKTSMQAQQAYKIRDHPRRCGENTFARSFRARLMGSPPQVRGKRCCWRFSPQERRITPAGAGKTAFSHRRCSPPQDHPRRCGENASVSFSGRMISGSPPQVRGKHRLATAGLQSTRITPAGAGKTRYTTQASLPT